MSLKVENVLEQERRTLTFNPIKLSEFLYGNQTFHQMQKIFDTLPAVPHDFNIFNESRVELIKEAYRNLPLEIQSIGLTKTSPQVPNQSFIITIYLLLNSMHQMPGSVHIGMFMKCIEMMGTKTQQERYLQKCKTYEMVGAYAQTQIGHGSDVQSLQTTATFDKTTNQFIVNTPSLSAAKYWPGQLGISANWALVFAQLISKGKNYGVQSFLVPIRDQNGNPLPGIEVGDIGPKIGFHTKDNGFLIMKNVRIPKSYMLRKFISLNKEGQIKIKGDPKIGYATMMTIRQHISCAFPKIYSQAIIIATRYSFFRRQFISSNKEQIKVIDYQVQQDKVINRVAEYYAITLGGNNLKRLCEQNFANVKLNENLQLMNQTHACLCMCKAFFSETVFNGMEILRKACGGHGYSHYSGLPSLIFQYAANLTHQGQNTVLYLQTARFLLKSYKYFVTKKKKIAKSVSYINSFDQLISQKCSLDPFSPQKITLNNIRVLLSQIVCYLISVVTDKLMTKEEGLSDAQVWNSTAGIRLQQMGISHAAYYTFTSFQQAITQEKDENIKSILGPICGLYGINILINNCGNLIEGGFVKNQHISLFKAAKESYLKKIRPNLVGIVDGFGIPQKFIRSAFKEGNIYQNLLSLARKSSINKNISESGVLVKNGIQQAIKPRL